MKEFYLASYKDGTKQVFMADAGINWLNVLTENKFIQFGTKVTSTDGVSSVDICVDDSKEKSLCYAQSIGQQEYEFVKHRQTKNDAVFPITKIDTLHTNGAFLLFQQQQCEKLNKPNEAIQTLPG